MILQALYGRYLRQVSQGDKDAPPFGFGPAPMHFALVLDGNGQVVDVDDLRITVQNRQRARELIVPKDFEDRTSGDEAPRALWDNAEYVLGHFPGNPRRAAKRAANFKKRQESLLAAAGDPGAAALLAFLAKWLPEQHAQLRYASEINEKSNLCFRLDGTGGFIHDRLLIGKAWVASLRSPGGSRTQCLATGEPATAARLHPLIKQIAKPGQPTPKLVAFDKDSTAFDSFGRKQGENAPVSEQVAFGYATALNGLLRHDGRNRIQFGDATTVYWAEAEAPETASNAELAAECLFQPTEAESDASATNTLRKRIMEHIAKGRPLESPELHLDPGTRFYILGLAPNAARLSVRFWEMTTLGALGTAFYQHWQDLRIETRGRQMLPPSIAALALQTAPARKNVQGEYRQSFDDVSPLLAGELTRAVLSGGRYPASLLSTLVMRIRIDGRLGRYRVPLIKATLVRAMRLEHRLPNPEYLMRSDPNDPNVARRLGRLFAIIERAQLTALGGDINTTIKDKFLGAAAATPAQVFVGLLKNSQHHTKRLRNGHSDANWIKDPTHARRAGFGIERDIGTLSSTFNDGFPAQHSIEEQGLFLVGYYQERFGGKADPAVGIEPGIDFPDDAASNNNPETE